MDSVTAVKVFLSGVSEQQTHAEDDVRDLQQRWDSLRKELDTVEKQLSRLRATQHQRKEKSKLTEVLLQNLRICSTEESFRQNLFELLEAVSVQPDECLVNDEMIQLRRFADNFEHSHFKPPTVRKAELTSEEKLHHHDQRMLRPIFTFKESDSYKLVSPYSVQSIRVGFVTVLAYPSLNTFRESIELSFFVKRVRPDWLGIGLTRTSNNFSLTERGFYLWVSNGWTFTDGKQLQTGQRFCQNDKITMRYDKSKNLLVMFKNGKSHEPRLTDMPEDVWNELHPCVVFYNKGDIVDILQ